MCVCMICFLLDAVFHGTGFRVSNGFFGVIRH